jgi:hypothetical protein
MAKVECNVGEVELENDRGIRVKGVRVECGRCDHKTESFGTGEKSIKRCLVLLRENCPQGEENYYVEA